LQARFSFSEVVASPIHPSRAALILFSPFFSLPGTFPFFLNPPRPSSAVFMGQYRFCSPSPHSAWRLLLLPFFCIYGEVGHYLSLLIERSYVRAVIGLEDPSAFYSSFHSSHSRDIRCGADHSFLSIFPVHVPIPRPFTALHVPFLIFCRPPTPYVKI